MSLSYTSDQPFHRSTTEVIEDSICKTSEIIGQTTKKRDEWMLKFSRKMKQGSAGKRNIERPSFEQECAENRIVENCIPERTEPSSMPYTTAVNKDVSAVEATPTRHNKGSRRHSNGSKNNLPPLFLYIEAGDFRRAIERAKRHPREVRAWATIKTKSKSNVGDNHNSDTTKRLALHQACFKVSSPL